MRAARTETEPHCPEPPARDEPYGDELPSGSELLHGQYRIESYLNAGGFGITYLARNSLGRHVVVKECFPGFLCFRTGAVVRPRAPEHEDTYDGLVDLFRQEASALASLDHPNIVGVQDVFDENETLYMVLDFVDGIDLQTMIEEEPDALSPGDIYRIVVELLGAVSYLHARGILHRDISPDNILLDRDNTPVLIDFGAARAAAPRSASALLSVKDGYSPHEFYTRGREHTPASDLYALAATAHFAISGEPPVESNTRLAAVAEGLPDPYEPLEGRFDRFDEAFLRAIDRGLALAPAERLQSAQEWLLAIDDRSASIQALERARLDARLDEVVAALVSETNAEIERTRGDREAVAAAEAERRRIRARALMPKASFVLTPEDRELFCAAPEEACECDDAAAPQPRKADDTRTVEPDGPDGPDEAGAPDALPARRRARFAVHLALTSVLPVFTSRLEHAPRGTE